MHVIIHVYFPLPGFMVHWDQDFTLTPVDSRETHLHVKVLECTMTKDKFICEFIVRLDDLISGKSKYVYIPMRIMYM
jgi:hypothetical protein